MQHLALCHKYQIYTYLLLMTHLAGEYSWCGWRRTYNTYTGARWLSFPDLISLRVKWLASRKCFYQPVVTAAVVLLFAEYEIWVLCFEYTAIGREKQKGKVSVLSRVRDLYWCFVCTKLSLAIIYTFKERWIIWELVFFPKTKIKWNLIILFIHLSILASTWKTKYMGDFN